MDVDPLPELAAIQAALESADLPDESRQTALWCLRQMGRPYRELLTTQEQRYADAIQGLAQAMLKHLCEKGRAGVADEFVARLNALHERVGLRPLNLRLTAPTGPPLAGPHRARRSSRTPRTPQ